MSQTRIENLTTSQILHESICKVAESGLEIFQTATFWDKFAFECSCFESFYPRKKDFLLFSFRAFSGSKVLNQNFCNVFNTKNKLYNASGFELCFLKRAKFWIENWTACEISKWIFWGVSVFGKTLVFEKSRFEIDRFTTEREVVLRYGSVFQNMLLKYIF